MSTAAPRLTIVAVLYGGAEVLRRTLPTWRASLGPATEVVIVDHSPEPLSGVVDLTSWSRYEWNPENPGFAAGANRGVHLARAERVFLLNPDVFLTPSDLAKVEEAAGDGPWAVALRTRGVEHRGIEFTWWGFCRDRVDRRAPLVGASGGAAVFRRTLVEEVPFPDHLFAWGEDAEWSLHLRVRGVRTSELPGMTLEHVGGHSVDSPSGQRLKARLLVRNRIATFRRLLSFRTKLVIAVPFFAAVAANAVRKVLQGTAPSYLRGIIEGLRMPVPARSSTVDWRTWRDLTRRRGDRS